MRKEKNIKGVKWKSQEAWERERERERERHSQSTSKIV